MPPCVSLASNLVQNSQIMILILDKAYERVELSSLNKKFLKPVLRFLSSFFLLVYSDELVFGDNLMDEVAGCCVFFILFNIKKTLNSTYILYLQ